MTTGARKDIAELREFGRALEGKRGPELWRSLEELADTEAFRRAVEREFPEQASTWTDTASRREFLKIMAASFALAGLQGCSKQVPEKIVPYVRDPEKITQGRPDYYATAIQRRGVALGVLAETHMGRPTKLEGNPEHPSSLGATDAFTQAEILNLYDPDRAEAVTNGGVISTWDAFRSDLRGKLEELKAVQGAGLRIVTGPVTSPTFIAEMERTLEILPKAKWILYEPIDRENAYVGLRLAFGRPLKSLYKFDQADVILSLSSDFLSLAPEGVRYAHDFAARRSARSADGKPEMSRLYVLEPTPTRTGMIADHRLPATPRQIEAFTRALAQRLQVPAPDGAYDDLEHGIPPEWMDAVIEDLLNYRLSDGRGGPLVITGPQESPAGAALVAAINSKLGAIGKTVLYTKPIHLDRGASFDALNELTREMAAGLVNAILIIGVNPVYSGPGDLKFDEALGKVPYRVHMSSHFDETSERCQWHVPLAHDLESWGDARAHDGTITFIQPVIEPLLGGRSPLELISILSSPEPRHPREIVRRHWASLVPEAEFPAFWHDALSQGFVPDSAVAPEELGPPTFPDGLPPETRNQYEPEIAGSVEVVFRPDPTIYDGSFANNAWLQELPTPIHKLTWENALHISPGLARERGIETGDLLEVSAGERAIVAPALITPGQAERVITMTVGYGRWRAGRVGEGLGYSAFVVRKAKHLWNGGRVTLRKTGERKDLPITQEHQVMEGRDLVRRGDLATLRENPERPPFMHGEEHEGASLYPAHDDSGYRWGMVIDLTRCTGCSACVVACQAENNIPVVGREQVLNNREMHWLRVDHYYEGPPENPRSFFQPVPCMHCETAPCEVVCPVAATTHSPEGLNEMTYNRCVGTRYCSNNCPYKVRRFNFLEYSDRETPIVQLMRNPDVTVRTRGVMEKCTYCVQRINEARINAGNEGRSIRDGELRTACQQVCPSRAILFGDLNDPEAQVTAARAEPTNYGLLEHLNTRPRTTYLAAIRNPNPRLGVEGA